MTDYQTIPDVHSIARDQLRAFVQRVERIEEEIKTLNDDKSDIYKEAAAVGFDKKTLKKVVARRKVDDSQRQEEDALFEIYWDAVHGTNLVHARVRENIEEFDAETGEILDGAANAKLIATVATGMQTEIGRKALVTALDIMIEREEAEEQVPSSEQSEGNGSRDHQHVHSRQTDGAKHGGQDGEPAGADHAPNPEMDRATEGSFETGSEAAEKGREAIPAGPEGADLNHAGAGESPATLPKKSAEQTGGEHEVATGSAMRAPTSNTGEGAASALPAKPKFVLRPYCRNPGETCGGSGTTHCHSCLKAREEVAA